MNSDERLERIAEQLARLETRLEALEKRLGPPPVPIIPPPRFNLPPQEPEEQLNLRGTLEQLQARSLKRYSERAASQAAAPPKPPTAPSPPSVTAPSPHDIGEAEYKIGALLPKVGAVVVLLGILYLVALAIAKGYVTPKMQWAGELVLCGAFIVVGLVKRNEREDFGQVLVGIGSCGLYFSFAGAYTFKHLITGETLTAAFALISVANLIVSGWLASRSFLVIGIMGGLVGALLPLNQEHPNVLMNGSLQLFIVAVAAIVICRHKWFEFAVLLFFAAMGCACAPIFPISRNEWTQIVFLYSDALICIGGIAYTRRKTEFDPQDALLPLAVFGVAVFGFCIRNGLPGTLHLAIFASSVALLGAAFWKNPIARNRLWAGAAAVALLLCPGGYEREAVAIYTLLTLAIALVTYKRFSTVLIFFAWTELLFALGAYVILSTWEKSWTEELALVVLLILANCSAGWVTHKRMNLSYEATAATGAFTALIGSVFLLRAGYLIGLRLDPLHRELLTQVYSALAMSAFAGILSLVRPSKFLTVYGWLPFGYALLNYVGLVYYGWLRWPEQLCILAPSVALSFLLALDIHRAFQHRLAAQIAAAAASIPLLLQAGYVIGMQIDPLRRQELTQVYTGLALAFACAWLTLVRKERFLLVLTCLLGSYSSIYYVELIGESKPSLPVEISMLVLMAGLVLLAGRATLAMSEDERPTHGIAIALLSLFVLRTGFIVGIGFDPLVRVEMTQIYSGILAGVVCALLAISKPSWVEQAFAWALGFYAAANYAVLVVDGRLYLAEELLLLSALGITLGALAKGTLKLAPRDETLAAAAILLWGLFWRTCFIVLTAKPIGMGEPAAITVSWTAYAVLLIAAGFIWRIQILRYLALLLFAVTLAKVFLYDLAALDPGIRVAVLMALGLAMIGGGYWYIRARHRPA